MKIAIASGKGGTGKTTVAANLAAAWALNGEEVTYVDCDVEEPNGHLFLKPNIRSTETVTALIPKVNNALCDGCGLCAEICNFSAIVVIAGKPLTFPELCHSCGGCSLVCSPKAIEEVPREIGIIETGIAGRQALTRGVNFISGKLKIGEAMPGPLIRKVKQAIGAEDLAIIDAPPGTSCPVVETIKGCDYVLLVTEPTPFGLNDLKLAVEVVRKLDLNHGILLNRAGLGDDRIHRFCREEGIDLIAEIPDDRKIAEAYSRGELLIQALVSYQSLFSRIITVIEEKTGRFESKRA